MTRLGGEVNMMIIDTADHVEDQNVKPVKPDDAMKQTEKQTEKQSETAKQTEKQTEEPMLDEAWTRLTTSFDVLLINGLATDAASALSIWGFHPNDLWWKEDHSGGHVYLVEWESETLSKIRTLVTDTAVAHRRDDQV